MNGSNSTSDSEYLPAPVRVIYFLLATCIVLSNGLVIFAYIRQRAIKKIIGPILLSLLVADLFVGALSVPMLIVGWVDSSRTEKGAASLCVMARCLVFFPITASVYSLVLMSVDRAISLAWTLRYSEIMTGRVISCILVLVWIWALVFSFIPAVEPISDFPLCEGNYNLIVFSYFCIITLLGIPFITVIILYSYMGTIAYGHLKQINKHETDMKKIRSNAKIWKTLKAARTACLITVGFALSWLPFLSSLTIALTFCTPLEKCPFDTNSIGISMGVTILLGMGHSFCNPILYVYRNKNLKKHIQAFILCRENTVREETTDLTIASTGVPVTPKKAFTTDKQ